MIANTAIFLALVGHVSSLTVDLPTQKKLVSFLSKAMDDPDAMAPTELAGMEAEIEMLVTKGDDPATKIAVEQMSDFVVKTLLPQRERSAKADQEMLETHAEQVKMCSPENFRKMDMNFHEDMEMAKMHRDNYQKHSAEHGGCLNVAEGKKMVRDARCAKIENYEEACKLPIPKADKEEKFQKKLQMKKTTEEETQECCDAHKAHEDHTNECKSSATEAEYASKQHELIMTRVCQQYDDCFTSKSELYGQIEKRVHAHEKRRNWHELYTIKCLVNTFRNGKVAEDEAKKCKTKQYPEAPEIKFPQSPVKQECKVKVALIKKK